jgi:hypothetical protein
MTWTLPGRLLAVVVPIVPSPAFTEGKMMQALAQAHLHNHKLTVRQLLEAAYYRKYQSRMPELALANDCKRFHEEGYVAPYLVEMLIATYGAQ